MVSAPTPPAQILRHCGIALALLNCRAPNPRITCPQTRGNQREIDRLRAQKRNEKNGKGNSDGLTPLQRKER